MTTYSIPIRNEGLHWTMAMSLNEVDYLLTFDWNTVASRWYFSVASPNDEDTVLMQVPILLGTWLKGWRTDPRLPPGDFYAVSTTKSILECGRDELGSRVLLYYQGGA